MSRAQRRAWCVGALRTLGVAALAASITGAAIELDGGESRGARAAFAMLLAAGCAAAMWWREERVDEREFARRADRRLALDGALATAHEARGSSELALLLAQRTVARLSPDSVRRAAPAPNLAWLAAPLAGFALWLAADRAAPPRDTQLAQLAGSLASTLAADSELAPERAADLRESAEQLADSAARGSADSAELAASARSLSDQLSDLARSLPPGSARALELLAAAQRLEALTARAATSGASGGASGGPQAGEGAAGVASAPLQSEPAERTMKGSPAQGAGPSTTPDERSLPRLPAGAPSGDAPWSPPALEPALLAGRWWAEDYDAVVAAWRESR